MDNDIIYFRSFEGGEDYRKYNDLLSGKNHYFKAIPLVERKFVVVDYCCKQKGDFDCSAIYRKKPSIDCIDFSYKPFKCKESGDKYCVGVYPCLNKQNSYCKTPNKCPIKPIIENGIMPGGYENVYFVYGFSEEVIIVHSGDINLIIEAAYDIAKNNPLLSNSTLGINPLLRELYQSPLLTRLTWWREYEEFENRIKQSYIYMGSKSKGIVIPIYKSILNDGRIEGGIFHSLVGHDENFRQFDVRSNNNTPFLNGTTSSMLFGLILRLFFSNKSTNKGQNARYPRMSCGEVNTILKRKVYEQRFANISDENFSNYCLVTEYNPVTRENGLVTIYRKDF